MKVKCIENHNYLFNITIGKTYEVINIYDNGYDIVNDEGGYWCYSKEYFRTLSEIRNEKINKLLEYES